MSTVLPRPYVEWIAAAVNLASRGQRGQSDIVWKYRGMGLEDPSEYLLLGRRTWPARGWRERVARGISKEDDCVSNVILCMGSGQECRVIHGDTGGEFEKKKRKVRISWGQYVRMAG